MRSAMPYVVLLGRVFFAAIFILASFGHFTPQYEAYAAAQGVPLPGFFVPLSGCLAFLGGFSILLGFRAKWGAWLIVIFLIPITYFIHNFWKMTDPMMASLQQIMFMKNLSMLGGALLITYFGSGPLSLDNHKKLKR
jgi:putative oxidoreductase